MLAIGLCLAAVALSTPALADTGQSSPVASARPRIIVLTDIGNEPDDQMSMVRLMLYANALDIEGLVATTSTWLKNQTNPQTIRDIVTDYGVVRPNLLLHAEGWPDAGQLLKVISVGQPGYGMAAVGTNKMSAGARAIIAAADRPDPRPIWISIWGGANTLAEALWHVRQTRTSSQLAQFIARLRVYSISDQDDAGPWIRRQFPGLFYIVTPSAPDSGNYAYATWTGISGDVYYRNGGGADGTTVTNAWLEQNIRNRGALSRHYLTYAFIMEGDTPAFLGLTDNGLDSAVSPGWGGWGGRYVLRKPFGETHAIWTQGGDEYSRVTSRDTVIGADGRTYTSDQATIWRWRSAYQNELAARMDWTIKSFKDANHNPVAIVNGVAGTAPIYIDAMAGHPIILNADASHDPDGQALTFHWFYYPEAGASAGPRADVNIAAGDSPTATVTPSSFCRPDWSTQTKTCLGVQAHIILEVTDNGKPALTTYRRIILTLR